MVEGVNPCPYCGYGKPQVYRRGGAVSYNYETKDWNYKYTYYVQCNKCFMRGPIIEEDREKAIWMWNGMMVIR